MSEAAERLRKRMADPFSRANLVHFDEELDAALAAERKATVERIRAAIYGSPPVFVNGEHERALLLIADILDAEAAR